MNPDLAWEVWASERSQRVENVLQLALPPATEPPQQLHEAMRYAVLGGGKRIRALLAYAAGELSSADPDTVDAAAAAVELIHAYSLIHDDLPCMDDDALRRGKPACHVAFGEATALLAGDALQSLAFERLASGSMPDSRAQIARLARASGSRGMAGGQAVDLANVGVGLTLNELERMHRLKTGALIQAAVRLGAACGRAMSAEENDALDRYADAVGLAFQVRDDVLDVEGTSQSLGKTAGKDAAQGKPTYVSLLGIVAAKARIESLQTEASAALGGLGAAARRLLELGSAMSARTR